MDIVVVHWLDALSDSGQVTHKQVLGMKPLPIISAGILIRNDDVGIVLTQDIMEFSDGDEEEYRHTEMIPKAYITKLQIISIDGIDDEHPND